MAGKISIAGENFLYFPGRVSSLEGEWVSPVSSFCKIPFIETS